MYTPTPFHIQILEKCSEFGDKYALKDHEDTFTFLDVRKKAYQVAELFRKRGIKKGSSILVCLPNCCWYPVVFLASAILGATISGISTQSTKDEINEYTGKSGAEAFVTTLEIAQALGDAAPRTDIIVISKKTCCGRPTIPRDLIEVEEQNFNICEVSLDDPLIMPFSSGTTGKPKCVILTHRNYLSATDNLKKAIFDELLDKNKKKTLAFLPFHHGSGFWALVFSLLEGCESIIMPQFHPITMLQLISTHRIEVINVVPSILRFLCQFAPSQLNLDVSCLTTILCGSSPLGPELSSNVLKNFPSVKHLVQGYGLSEIVVLSHITPLTSPKEKLGSCGKLIPGFQAKIVAENGDIVKEPKKHGELFLKSECVMKGYKNELKLHPFEDGDWFRTGDVVYFDSDHYFYVVDRLKDLIKVNGLQVSPSEIEDVIQALPFVVETCVIGVHHDLHGEVPKAYVVLTDRIKEQNKNFVLEEIMRHVKEVLAPYKQLRYIEAIKQLPKTASGKIARNMVRKLHTKRF
ncbi:unnamed protein product [Auanema sp. JU1783]|nr:unnamed protein product [Auanema sp. JU1783]